jgi:hypothetical protein
MRFCRKLATFFVANFDYKLSGGPIATRSARANRLGVPGAVPDPAIGEKFDILDASMAYMKLVFLANLLYLRTSGGPRRARLYVTVIINCNPALSPAFGKKICIPRLQHVPTSARDADQEHFLSIS